MTFKVAKISGPMGECDCCGCYSASGYNIYFNDELIWRQYSDGHLGGDCSEESILNAVVNAWNEFNIQKIEAQFTEEKRHEWNKDHPGNGVARTVENWKEYKEQMLEFQKDAFDSVKESCSNLPYDETLQVKMICLWIESHSGEKIQVLEDTEYEGDYDEEF
jgi:hypothetical protein